MPTDEDEAKYQPDLVKSPGQILRETLEDLGISHLDFMETAGIDSDYFYKFLAGKAPLSDELAQRLEKWAKLPAWLWKRHERRYRKHLEEKASNES